MLGFSPVFFLEPLVETCWNNHSKQTFLYWNDLWDPCFFLDGSPCSRGIRTDWRGTSCRHTCRQWHAKWMRMLVVLLGKSTNTSAGIWLPFSIDLLFSSDTGKNKALPKKRWFITMVTKPKKHKSSNIMKYHKKHKSTYHPKRPTQGARLVSPPKMQAVARNESHGHIAQADLLPYCTEGHPSEGQVEPTGTNQLQEKAIGTLALNGTLQPFNPALKIFIRTKKIWNCCLWTWNWSTFLVIPVLIYRTNQWRSQHLLDTQLPVNARKPWDNLSSFTAEVSYLHVPLPNRWMLPACRRARFEVSLKKESWRVKDVGFDAFRGPKPRGLSMSVTSINATCDASATTVLKFANLMVFIVWPISNRVPLGSLGLVVTTGWWTIGHWYHQLSTIITGFCLPHLRLKWDSFNHQDKN